MEPDRLSRDEICVVAAAPSVTPWSLRRESAALRQGAVDAVFATVASLEDTGLVGAFARLGVRVIQPTYNYRSAAGDGCCEPANAGLSLFGKALVKAMNQHRAAVDIAHAGVRTSLEAIECSTRPVIASHANARTVCEHPRNLPDEVIKAVAASGGVIGLCAFPSFVSAGPHPALDQLIDHAVHIEPGRSRARRPWPGLRG